MFRLLNYYAQWQGFRGRVTQLPAWARLLLMLAAIPGILLIALSILAFLVSLLALFLLTVPVYRLVRWITAGRQRSSGVGQAVTVIDPADADYGSPGRKPVQGTLIE